MNLARPFFILLIVSLFSFCLFAQNASAGDNSANNSNNLAGVNPHAISLYNLGLSAYKQGSPESAIIFFKRAVDLDPDLADAQYNLGVLYQSERRLKEAVPRFQEALRVKPEDPDSHYQLALALIDLNQLPEAKQQLLAIAPNNGHFNEAQKKISFIDSQLAGNQSTTGTASTQPINTPSTVSQATNQTGASTGNSYTNPASPAQSGASSIASTPNASPNVANSPAGSPTSSSNDATQSNSANTNIPTALAPNTTVEVIANGFAAPSGLSFDRQGNLYIANFLNSTIDRIAPDGTKTQFSSGINLKGPIGLVNDAENNLYVANYLAGTVTKINPAGIAQIIVSGLKKPYYLTMDKQGNLFVSQQEDNSIVRINFTGNNMSANATTNNVP